MRVRYSSACAQSVVTTRKRCATSPQVLPVGSGQYLAQWERSSNLTTFARNDLSLRSRSVRIRLSKHENKSIDRLFASVWRLSLTQGLLGGQAEIRMDKGVA